MIHTFIGTKAQLIKMAPIMRRMQEQGIDYNFIFSGQHQATIDYIRSEIGLAENINEIELALWFHDAIYKPRSSTNELDSANLSAEFLHRNLHRIGR